MPKGIEVGPVPKALSDDELVAMLRLCIFGREFDKKAIALQRRGKLGTFAPMSGQEAVVVGSVFALDRDHDWVVPQYREQLAMLHWGLDAVDVLPPAPGPPTRFGPARARPPVPPAGRPRRPPAPRRRRGLGDEAEGRAVRRRLLLRRRSVVGGRLPRVVQLRRRAQGAGDLHLPEQPVGDLHAACRSRPPGRSPTGRPATGSPGCASTATIPLAMYQVTADARARALAGEGPTLIEAVTYRLGAHTTADDPTRYVDPDEEERWKARDPLIRFRAWMRATGRWDDDAERGRRGVVHGGDRPRRRRGGGGRAGRPGAAVRQRVGRRSAQLSCSRRSRAQ